MKVFVYSYRSFDEGPIFQDYASKYQIELGVTDKRPTLSNLSLAEGYDYINIITTPIDKPMLMELSRMGIKMITTRTIGYDHIDFQTAKELGIKVSNITYDPHCVAEYTLMLMLMSLRRMKQVMARAAINDFTLKGIQGRVMKNLTVGVLGTGRIGTTLIELLSGFGCRILAYDKYQNDTVKKYASYTDLSTIYKECDLISLHMPSSDETFHMIDKEAISQMKENVVIINTARGSLICLSDLMDALESGKIGAAGLDVIEEEFDLYYYDRKNDILPHRTMSILRGYPNVILSPHMAFYSDQTIHDMVKNSLKSCVLEEQGLPNPWLVRQ
ncbi:MAG: D-isomer specific 2-hydroxyacid dehydrogenase family protein [Lachnospiraceae bacterium]|nr:D-isomer specific 2-hydroxyacid dehydrogenase family protein [Lachnospiraceae bacterium]